MRHGKSSGGCLKSAIFQCIKLKFGLGVYFGPKIAIFFSLIFFLPFILQFNILRLNLSPPSHSDLSSSVFSLGDWGEDEFDRAATRKVKSLFEDVDSWMFEQDNRVEGSLSQTSRKECVEWVDKFIHCRTLGMNRCPRPLRQEEMLLKTSR